MTQKKTTKKQPKTMPTAERVAAELATACSMDDFFGRNGLFARLFAATLEEMLAAELSDHLGYDKHEARGRNSGNSLIVFDNRKQRQVIIENNGRYPITKKSDHRKQRQMITQNNSRQGDGGVRFCYFWRVKSRKRATHPSSFAAARVP